MTRPVKISDPASSRGFTRGSSAAASITLLLITGHHAFQIVLGSPMRFERITGNPESAGIKPHERYHSPLVTKTDCSSGR